MDPEGLIPFPKKSASYPSSEPDKHSPSPPILSYYYNRLEVEKFRHKKYPDTEAKDDCLLLGCVGAG